MVSAVLRLDEVQSNGAPGTPIETSRARLMALSMKSPSMWFGFVIDGAKVILPGSEVDVRVAFLDHDGARAAFVPGASVLFGDGV